MKHFKLFEQFINELNQTSVSGTKSGWTTSLEDRKYQLKKDVKGAQIGDFVNVVLPKGTIIYNLPGGVFADHFSLKNKYSSKSSQGPQWFDKPTFKGISIRQKPEVLKDIEKNGKVLESVNEGKTYQEKFKEEEATYKEMINNPNQRVYDMVDFAQFTTGGMTQKQWEMFMHGRYKKFKDNTDKPTKEKMYKVLTKWLGESTESITEGFSEWEMSFAPMILSGVKLDPKTVYKVKARTTVEAIKKAAKEAGLSGNDWMATVTNKLEKIK